MAKKEQTHRPHDQQRFYDSVSENTSWKQQLLHLSAELKREAEQTRRKIETEIKHEHDFITGSLCRSRIVPLPGMVRSDLFIEICLTLEFLWNELLGDPPWVVSDSAVAAIRHQCTNYEKNLEWLHAVLEFNIKAYEGIKELYNSAILTLWQDSIDTVLQEIVRSDYYKKPLNLSPFRQYIENQWRRECQRLRYPTFGQSFEEQLITRLTMAEIDAFKWSPSAIRASVFKGSYSDLLHKYGWEIKYI